MSKKILLFLLLLPSVLFSQTDAQRSKIVQQTNTKVLTELSKKYKAEFQRNRKLAEQLAKKYNWQYIIKDKYTYSELIGVTENGKPIYYSTYNEGAGITSRANKLYTGGGLGLNIHGENMVTALWDAGSGLVTHQLFGGRIHTMDDCPSTHPHATHVAGTIIGSDLFQGGHARGMAFKANLNSYDWDNDDSEVATAAASGLLLSNHSYGYSAFSIQDYQWGKYDSKSRNYDDIMFNAPYYQFVCAAGNSRGSFNMNKNGYDLLSGMGLAKNGITVAAVAEVLNYTGPASVQMSPTSSWGPADDGRIKPDICAKGMNTFSAIDSSNSSYEYLSGTSMAAPSVDGTLLLLQQYFNQVSGTFMRASTLKALMIHTADETGLNPGPDYSFGWGLINAEKAANVITEKGLESYILENTLTQNDTFSIDVNAIGAEPLIATLCWTDPKGSLHSLNVDDATPDLVNDLDIRITQDGSTFYPWKLSRANPTNAAVKGDNIVDNVERSEIANPTGNYTITVSHKGSLQNGLQKYSLIVSGITLKKFWFTTTESSKNICNTTDSEKYTFNLNTTSDFNETVTFSAVNLPAGITAIFSPTQLNVPGIFDVTLGNLTSLAPGNYSFIIRGQSASDAFQMNVNLNVLAPAFIPVTLTQPLNNATSVANPTLFSWQADSNSQLYDLQIASDADFSNIVESASVTTGTYTSTTLNNDRVYFWRVRKANLCGTGNFSIANTFSTACIPPTNIALVNITKTTATIGWTDSATSWNVEIVLQGNLPTGMGTTTNSNPTLFNNLLPNTCYDFYLQAPCSTVTSTWLAPFTFCTTPDYCAGDHFYDSGGASGNYSNNEDKTTTIYPANPGDRVRVEFSEFDLSSCCDYIIVFNGPNDTYPFLVYLNGDDIPDPIASTDITGALTFVFHSNGNNTDEGWDATVFCEPL
ncbi:MAG TPA: S8 family serine peptidase, partial [Flavobacterium sp.]|nr:S8 family serine peptidase [Flavobacterium sp.]